jgi:uncharacterized protein
MQFIQENYPSPPIQSYDMGGIKIQDILYSDSLIIAPSGIYPHWRPTNVAELTQTDLQCLLDLTPEVILLGTGSRLSFPHRDLLAWVAQYGFGLEIMDSAAACRTYNLLLAEGRQVVAGLLIDPSFVGQAP